METGECGGDAVEVLLTNREANRVVEVTQHTDLDYALRKVLGQQSFRVIDEHDECDFIICAIPDTIDEEGIISWTCRS